MIGVQDRIITGNAQDSFHAVTFLPNPEVVAREFVPRPRLLDLLNRPPTQNAASVLIAPTGFGKTTLARQWVADGGTDVQVVYVRKPTDVPLENVGSPSHFGIALANLLNAVTFHSADHSEADIRELLELALHFSRETPSRFVLDDLDYANHERVTGFVSVIGEYLMRYRGEHGLFISRSIATSIMSAFHGLGAVRVLLPQQFAFDVRETEAAHEAGVFGTASLEQVMQARENNAGWLAGMLAECDGSGGKTTSQSDFDSLVLNELVQREACEAQHILVATSMLPRITMPLWSSLFAEMEVAEWQEGHILSQVPYQLEDDRIVMPAVFIASLRRMATFITESQRLRRLLDRALRWYIDTEDYASARELAASQHMEPELLRHIKPVCRQLALQENWQALSTHLSAIPHSVILQDSDYTFWMLHVLAGEGSWTEMLSLYDRISDNWQNSADPLDLGRDQLVKGWIAHTTGQYQEAFEHSETAYDTLPAEAHQERMYAASTARISQSQVHLSAETSEWQRRAAQEIAFLPDNQRWWHNNVGPMAYEQMVHMGKLTDAYDLAARQTAQLVASHPALTTRYLLIMALIDIERLRFDSAALLISRASDLADTRGLEHYAQAVEALLYEAREDYDAANHLLSAGPMTSVTRADFRFRQSLYMARVALAYGDAATADVLLSNIAWPADPWPRRLGDPHPWLLQALICSLRGRPDNAIAHAERTLEEARKRNHTYLQVASRATLAHLYHGMGELDLRDHEIGLAIAASGDSGFQRAFYVRGQDIRTLVNTIPAPPARAVQSAPVLPYPHPADTPRLTQRERELIALVGAGYSNQQIADELYISLSTVKNHLANVYEKLGAGNRREATRIAQKLGIIKN